MDYIKVLPTDKLLPEIPEGKRGKKGGMKQRYAQGEGGDPVNPDVGQPAGLDGATKEVNLMLPCQGISQGGNIVRHPLCPPNGRAQEADPHRNTPQTCQGKLYRVSMGKA